jgi:hypothetical protein
MGVSEVAGASVRDQRSGVRSQRSRVRGIALALVCALGALAPSETEAQTHVVVITGIGREDKYIEQFRTLGASLSEALNKKYGIADSSITWLGEDSVAKPPRYKGLATRENIERALTRIASVAKPNDQVIMILIGHGSGEGMETKLSIPGPDLSTADFARQLDRLAAQRVAFVNLSTASGDMLPLLSSPNRVVITATRTAFERNESQFGRFFVDAIAQDGADSDKDGRVSLLEAFAYASTETKRHYENAGTLMTEHAQLDDDGDKKGDQAPTGRVGDGMTARRFFLDAGAVAARVAATSPELVRLYTERGQLEEQVDQLKRRKATMSPEAYDAELEKALLALARVSRDIRRLEGRGS